MVHTSWQHVDNMNYNGPKVKFIALVKFGYMLEPSYYYEAISREVVIDPSETTRRTQP